MGGVRHQGESTLRRWADAGQVRTFINEAENEKYNRKRGFTEFISVRRPWRKRGLARALIVRSLQLQKEQGMTESALGADSENISGATIEASELIMNLGASRSSFHQVIFSFGTAPEYEP